MKIIAHRGCWGDSAEPNSMAAFQMAARGGFGIEVDVRDHRGGLVVEHDPPVRDADPLLLEELLRFWSETSQPHPVLLDLKASGLAEALGALLQRYVVPSHYVFDAAIPDLYRYREMGIPYLSRWSDVETTPALEADSHGICVDGFESDWFSLPDLQRISRDGRLVVIISPELHARPHRPVWDRIAPLASSSHSGDFAICTDLPELARSFFGA